VIENSRIKELCFEAHNNSVEFYSSLAEHGHINESNEHFVASHVTDVFAKELGLFVSMETVRSLIELAIVQRDKDILEKCMDRSAESTRNRFDVVVWKEKKPLLVFEIKTYGNDDLLEKDIDRLWLLQRRLGAKHAFKCVFMYSNWHVKNGKDSWKSKIANFGARGYTFDSFFDQKRLQNNTNWCAGLIIDYQDVGINYRIK
jgi:hypothetical protein